MLEDLEDFVNEFISSDTCKKVIDVKLSYTQSGFIATILYEEY